MKTRIGVLLGLLILPLVVSAAALKPGHDAVASAHPLATQAGMQILAEGGNAFDAAVAVSAALAVESPTAPVSVAADSGYCMWPRTITTPALMVANMTPAAASASMYQDKNGNVIPDASLNGPMSAAIPGEPAALVYLNKHYGRLSLGQDLAPAIKMARDGFPLDQLFHEMIANRVDKLKQWPAAAAVFIPGGQVPPTGYLLKQMDLARTLELIVKNGNTGFYTGELAREMVDAVRANGGIWSLADLRDYKVIERTPLVGSYQDMRMVSAPPPSSGGVVMLEALNILSGYKLPNLSDLMQKHYIIEAMRYAYRDRAEYLGDPRLYKCPCRNY